MPDAFAGLRHELAVANRILANEGIIDAFGHISVRNPKDPNRYFISRHRASELVEPSDILEMTLDSKPVVPTNVRLYSEMVIHGEIYKVRPDVNSVCHHHAPSVLPFCATGVERAWEYWVTRLQKAEATWAAAGLPRMKELSRIARPQTAGLASARSAPQRVARAASKTRARNRR